MLTTAKNGKGSHHYNRNTPLCLGLSLPSVGLSNQNETWSRAGMMDVRLNKMESLCLESPTIGQKKTANAWNTGSFSPIFA